MNILYTFDDLFAEVAGISILSLFENNKDADEINVYAICNCVSDENKQRLMKLQDDYGRKIIFLAAPDVEKIAGTAIEIQNWPIANFFRLFISSLLPPDMNKILYLDCDTTIQSSLSGLWNMEQGGNIVSGVRNCDNLYLKNRRRLFLKRNDPYINAGVMLINLELWRHYGVEEKFIKFIRLMEGKVPPSGGNQGVINSVLKGYIGTIDPMYNYFYMRVNKKLIHAKDKKRVREIARQNNPVVVHYFGIRYMINNLICGLDAPDILYFRSDWYKWREMSPWRGLPLDYLQSPPPQWCPPPVTTKRKTIRSSILRFAERNCKPLHSLLSRLGVCLKAFLRRIKRLFKETIPESSRIRKYNKHRQKVTGINIKDCRIGKPI
ncbi:MAG: glycosyltransferase family 8 protein [Oscillospiraceae bacterium]|nr:glycosyltransferase family 8 protein [Oscillospiraceae bacterium]